MTDPPRSLRSIILTPLLISFAFAVACYAAAGAALGLFLGTLAGLTILIPPLVLREQTRIARVLAAGAVIDGAALATLLPVFWGPINFGPWLASYLILIAYGLALAGITTALSRATPEILASATTVIIGLAWLTWPIWLSETLRGSHGERTVSWLVPAHPLFATNAVLKDLGIWTERSVAYRLTNLNQHVPYSLPTSILPCLAVHLLIGTRLFWLSTRCALRSTTQIDASANTPSTP